MNIYDNLEGLDKDKVIAEMRRIIIADKHDIDGSRERLARVERERDEARYWLLKAQVNDEEFHKAEKYLYDLKLDWIGYYDNVCALIKKIEGETPHPSDPLTESEEEKK